MSSSSFDRFPSAAEAKHQAMEVASANDDFEYVHIRRWFCGEIKRVIGLGMSSLTYSYNGFNTGSVCHGSTTLSPSAFSRESFNGKTRIGVDRPTIPEKLRTYLTGLGYTVDIVSIDLTSIESITVSW